MAGAAAETRPSFAGVRLLGAIAGLAPAPAAASAWIAPEGQLIWNEFAGARDERLYLESSAYLEAPTSRDFAFVASGWAGSDDPIGTGWDGLRGEAALGVKKAVAEGPRHALAVQATAVWRSDAEAGCSEVGAEARFMGGTSFGEGRGFVNLEAGVRSFGGGCTTGRYELAVGYRPTPRLMTLAQIYADDTTGDEAVRAQLSLVRFGEDERIGFQIGVRARVDGEDAEPALVLGLWMRRGD